MNNKTLLSATILLILAQPALSIEVEPNNDSKTANPLGLENVGQLSKGSDVDFFSIDNSCVKYTVDDANLDISGNIKAGDCATYTDSDEAENPTNIAGEDKYRSEISLAFSCNSRAAVGTSGWYLGVHDSRGVLQASYQVKANDCMTGDSGSAGPYSFKFPSSQDVPNYYLSVIADCHLPIYNASNDPLKPVISANTFVQSTPATKADIDAAQAEITKAKKVLTTAINALNNANFSVIGSNDSIAKANDAILMAKDIADQSKPNLTAATSINAVSSVAKAVGIMADAMRYSVQTHTLFVDADKAAKDPAVQAAINTAGINVTQAEIDIANAKAVVDSAQQIVQTTVDNAKTALSRVQKTLDTALIAVDTATTVKTEAQIAVDTKTTVKVAAQTTLDNAKTTLTTAKTALTAAQNQPEVILAQSILGAVQTQLTAAQTLLVAPQAILSAAQIALTKAQTANPVVPTTLSNAKTAYDTAKTAYDTAKLAAEIDAIQATYDTAQTKLAAIKIKAGIPTAQSDLTTAQSELTTATTAFTIAQSDLTIATTTRDAAQMALTKAQTEFDAANAAVNAAQTKVDNAEIALAAAKNSNSPTTDAQAALIKANEAKSAIDNAKKAAEDNKTNLDKAQSDTKADDSAATTKLGEANIALAKALTILNTTVNADIAAANAATDSGTRTNNACAASNNATYTITDTQNNLPKNTQTAVKMPSNLLKTVVALGTNKTGQINAIDDNDVYLVESGDAPEIPLIFSCTPMAVRKSNDWLLDIYDDSNELVSSEVINGSDCGSGFKTDNGGYKFNLLSNDSTRYYLSVKSACTTADCIVDTSNYNIARDVTKTYTGVLATTKKITTKTADFQLKRCGSNSNAIINVTAENVNLKKKLTPINVQIGGMACQTAEPIIANALTGTVVKSSSLFDSDLKTKDAFTIEISDCGAAKGKVSLSGLGLNLENLNFDNAIDTISLPVKVDFGDFHCSGEDTFRMTTDDKTGDISYTNKPVVIPPVVPPVITPVVVPPIKQPCFYSVCTDTTQKQDFPVFGTK
jgi:hypothetical protein